MYKNEGKVCLKTETSYTSVIIYVHVTSILFSFSHSVRLGHAILASILLYANITCLPSFMKSWGHSLSANIVSVTRKQKMTLTITKKIIINDKYILYSASHIRLDCDEMYHLERSCYLPA